MIHRHMSFSRRDSRAFSLAVPVSLYSDGSDLCREHFQKLCRRRRNIRKLKVIICESREVLSILRGETSISGAAEVRSPVLRTSQRDSVNTPRWCAKDYSCG